MLKSGQPDYIVSQSGEVLEVGGSGSPRRSGGQGDILTGLLAAFTAWAHRGSNEVKIQVKLRITA